MTITRRILLTASAGLVFALTLARAAGLQVGVATPDFTGINRNGQSVALQALRGRLVEHEWTNDGFPFVQKWYVLGLPQRMQRDAAGLGAVWVSVIS